MKQSVLPAAVRHDAGTKEQKTITEPIKRKDHSKDGHQSDYRNNQGLGAVSFVCLFADLLHRMFSPNGWDNVCFVSSLPSME